VSYSEFPDDKISRQSDSQSLMTRVRLFILHFARGEILSVPKLHFR